MAFGVMTLLAVLVAIVSLIMAMVAMGQSSRMAVKIAELKRDAFSPEEKERLRQTIDKTESLENRLNEIKATVEQTANLLNEHATQRSSEYAAIQATKQELNGKIAALAASQDKLEAIVSEVESFRQFKGIVEQTHRKLSDVFSGVQPTQVLPESEVSVQDYIAAHKGAAQSATEYDQPLQSADAGERGTAYSRFIGDASEKDALELARRGLQDPDAIVREKVIEAMDVRACSLDEGILFWDMLADHSAKEGDVRLRQDILRRLVLADTDRYQDVFLRVLNEAGSKSSLGLCFEYFCKHPHEAAREAILTYVTSDQPDPALLPKALEALARLAKPEDGTVIAKFVQHPDMYVKASAAEQLGRLDAEAYMHTLGDLDESSEVPVIRAARSALLRLAPPDQQFEGLMILLEELPDQREHFKILEQLLELGRQEAVESYLLREYPDFEPEPRRTAWQMLLRLGIYVPTPGIEPDRQPWKGLAERARTIEVDLSNA